MRNAGCDSFRWRSQKSPSLVTSPFPSTGLYRRAPKWFVTLHGAEHRRAFTDEPSPYDDLVTHSILDFWHGTLDGDDAALERVTADATDPTLSTVEHE